MEEHVEKSTVLNLQKKLFYKVNANIVSEINHDQTIITASNISEFDFSNLIFITNSPFSREPFHTIIGIDVFLNTNLFPTPIYGLLEIVKARLEFSDVDAFVTGKIVHNPFQEGFGKLNKTIKEVIKTLASLTDEMPEITDETVMMFQIRYDPAGKEKLITKVSTKVSGGGVVVILKSNGGK